MSNAANSDTVHKKGDVVMIAMDGSEYSDYALQFYMEALHKPDNTVILAHCTEYKTITSPVAMMGDPSLAMVTQEIDAEEAKTSALVEKLSQKLQNLNMNANIENIYGEPGPAIITLSTAKKVDYIVVGCRGKGTVRRTLTGSVTDYITHHSHVPVMIARHRDHMKHHHGFHFKNPLKKKHDHHHEHHSGQAD